MAVTNYHGHVLSCSYLLPNHTCYRVTHNVSPVVWPGGRLRGRAGDGCKGGRGCRREGGPAAGRGVSG
eukprot:459647-Prymnesium_polylepis.1